jgi:hypothetical protein
MPNGALEEADSNRPGVHCSLCGYVERVAAEDTDTATPYR